MKYAVIGTGYWGENHVRVASELYKDGFVDEVVLCDIDEKRVSELAEQYGFDYTTEHDELGSLGVDVATVATPSMTHEDIATTLLRDGIDVLVEKPLSVTSDSAWQIVETADKHDRTLAVGHIFRHHPALMELKDRIDRGELGDIKYLQTNRFSFRVPRETVGVLYSLAVHDVDIYSYLLDEQPESLFCRLDRWVRDDIDETASLTLQYGETTGVINESWQIPVFGKRRDLIVVGTERSAHVDYLEDNVIEMFNYRIDESADQYRVVEEGPVTHHADDFEPLRCEVENVIDACRGEATLRCPGRVGAETIELLEAAELSDEKNAVVEL